MPWIVCASPSRYLAPFYFRCSQAPLARSLKRRSPRRKRNPRKRPPEPVNTPEFEQGQVKADLALIDKSLHALADATLTAAAKPGDEGGLPSVTGEYGISCGSDSGITAALSHIGFGVKGLQAGAGFHFADVCVGWQPFVKPRVEMYWMISAGDKSKESGLLEYRRCIRVRGEKGSFSKDEILDGPCLALHLRDRELSEAAEEAGEAAKLGGGKDEGKGGGEGDKSEAKK